MHYTFFAVQRYSNPDHPFNYDMPILASDALYARMPEDINTRTTILSGREEGYDDISLFFADVCNALAFNPFAVKKFMLAYDAVDTIEQEVIEAFMGEYEVTSSNFQNYYPAIVEGQWLGYSFFGNGYGNKQASIAITNYGGQTNYYATLYNCIKINTFISTNDGITYEFEVWPEDAITSGAISTSHFVRDNNNLIKTCHVFINIWKNANTGKYNFNVQVGSGYYKASQTTYADTYLNGADLGHIYNPANPMDNKEQEGDEGGNGDWDNISDNIPVPELPTLDITALGGLHLYRLTAGDFASLMSYLGSNAPGDAILKWFSNPIQGITAAYILPYPAHASGSGSITVLGMPTGVSAYTVDQWEKYNLGSVYIATRYGDCFLDYSPMTRVSMYLPFCGVKQLCADDIIGHNVGVVYELDNISGACVVFVTSDGSVKYTFNGSCAIGIPISQSNWGQTYMAAATAAAGAISGGIGAAGSAIAQGASKAGIAMSAAAGAVQGGGGLSAFESKPYLSRSGSFTGAGSALGIEYPFLIIERPTKTNMGDPKSIIGITSSRVLPLGSLSGFNSIEHCHLHGIAATAEELDEIERLLYEGVIF